MVPLNAVIQYGHHHIFTRVSHLPGPHDVHVGLAVMDVAVAVLERLWQETRRKDEGSEKTQRQKFIRVSQTQNLKLHQCVDMLEMFPLNLEQV